MSRILTITLNPAVDISGDTDVVTPTRKVRTSGTRHDPGGGGINVARVIAELGGDAEAVFLAGGEIGPLLDRLLAEEGLRRRLFPIAGQTRVDFVVQERKTGLEYRLVAAGPAVGPDELEPCFQAIASHIGGYVVASGSLPDGAPSDTYVRMAELAAASGSRFVLDTSGEGLQAALERSRIFLVKPSLGELEKLVGRQLDDDGAGRAAAGIVARGAAEMVAVTMGADGALLATSTGLLRVPPIHVRVRSAVGAGDSFLGAMVWALSEGKAVGEAFRFGVAAGAAAVMTPGTELCRRGDVIELFEMLNARGGDGGRTIRMSRQSTDNSGPACDVPQVPEVTEADVVAICLSHGNGRLRKMQQIDNHVRSAVQ
ncbi:6-phosphofructokinase [Hoeflea marina]|uniref:6-phosphofructokinase n=1 Tax=Hoeflea marina TaxID=274592 RepID=A0A317PKG1_9HYPH|nr:1-phosphofructokinase family hexose kinase [Hoeflea marina]PWW01452.1 6-phosphofructokinase [Hoeflea marina]